jgi:hypothetical protein
MPAILQDIISLFTSDLDGDQCDITQWMVDPDEYRQELADILIAQLSVNQELREAL